MMKKIFAVIMVFAILLVSAPVTFAYNTYNTNVSFYIQRFGAQMDSEGEIASRDVSYFTPVLFKGQLTSKRRDESYSIVYKAGSVSSADVISEVVSKPADKDIIESVKNEYSAKGGYVLSSNGKVVDWSKFDTTNYEIRWYVLKYEKTDSPKAWHVDGVIVEKETQLPIEIPTPGDTDYVPPEELPKEGDKEPEIEPRDEIISPVGITSKHAYIYGYNDSIMAADNNLQRGEVCAMVHRLAKQNKILDDYHFDEASDPVYPDTAGEWFRSGVEFVQFKNGFKAAAGENVHPYVNVTRGETFRIVCLAFDFTTNAELSYGDYANILFDEGFIRGDEDGNLNIWDQITRAEFCAIYNKIIGRDKAELVTADGTKVTAATYGFTDLDENEWYYETMLKATSAYDDNGYVDIELRNHRNVLDDYQ